MRVLPSFDFSKSLTECFTKFCCTLIFLYKIKIIVLQLNNYQEIMSNPLIFKEK